MKPMLDNEIDNLFKSSFEDYQLKPSGESWKKISSKLADKPGNGNRYYWLVAASIILLFSIGIRFYGNADKVIKLSADTPNDEDAGVVLAVNKPKKVVPLKILTLEEVRLNNEKIFLKLIGETDTSLEHKDQLENNIGQENFLADNVVTTNNAKREKEELYPKSSRAADVTVRDLINERVLGKEDTHSPNDLSAAAFHKGDSSAGKNKIKSVGDLVNFVIAKVDSRDQKLLHFSKTEESDVEITGINLGLFKYKKN